MKSEQIIEDMLFDIKESLLKIGSCVLEIEGQRRKTQVSRKENVEGGNN